MIKRHLLYTQALNFLMELGAEKANAEAALDKTTRLLGNDLNAVIVETKPSYSTVRNVSTKDDFFYKYEVAYSEEPRVLRYQAYVELLRLKVYTLDAIEVLNKASQQGKSTVNSSDNKSFLVRSYVENGTQKFIIEEKMNQVYTKTSSLLTMEHYMIRMGIPRTAATAIRVLLSETKMETLKAWGYMRDIEQAGIAIKEIQQPIQFSYGSRLFTLKVNDDQTCTITYFANDFPDVDKGKPFLIKVEELDDKLIYQYTVQSKIDTDTIRTWLRTGSYYKDVLNTLCFNDELPQDTLSWLQRMGLGLIITQSTRFFYHSAGVTMEYSQRSKVLTVTISKTRITELC